MRFSAIFSVVLATSAAAAPSFQERTVDPIYGPSNPVVNSICPAPTERPLTGLFPFANLLGSIVNPILAGVIGQGTIEFLDDVAGVLCIATLNDPSICRKSLGAFRNFIDANTPLTQSKEFGCLLDYLCIAHAGPANEGTCNLLLESADCIANRIIGALDLECE